MGYGVFAFGTTLTWNTVVVAEITDLTGPSLKIAPLDVTTHGSTGAWREKVAGLKDGGQITITGNFYPGDTPGQKAFVDDMIAGTPRTAIITPPTTAPCTFTFTAFSVAFDPRAPVAGALTFTATLEITGVPVFAVTASANLTTLTGIEETGAAALTFTPTFTGAKKLYNITVNTATTWIKLTPTLTGAITTITTSYDNYATSQTVASGAQSGTIAVTDAAVTTVLASVKETGKVANVYKLEVYTA